MRGPPPKHRRRVRRGPAPGSSETARTPAREFRPRARSGVASRRRAVELARRVEERREARRRRIELLEECPHVVAQHDPRAATVVNGLHGFLGDLLGVEARRRVVPARSSVASVGEIFASCVEPAPRLTPRIAHESSRLPARSRHVVVTYHGYQATRLPGCYDQLCEAWGDHDLWGSTDSRWELEAREVDLPDPPAATAPR